MHYLAKIYALPVATTVGLEFWAWRAYFQPGLRANKGPPLSALLPVRWKLVTKDCVPLDSAITAEPKGSPCSEERGVVPERAADPTDAGGSQIGLPKFSNWKDELAKLVSIADNWEDEVDDDGNFFPLESQPCTPQVLPIAEEDGDLGDGQPPPQVARRHHIPSLSFIADVDEESEEPESDQTSCKLSRKHSPSAEDAHEQAFTVAQVSEKFMAGTEFEEVDESQLDPVDLATHHRLLIAHNTGLANTWAVADVNVESFNRTIDREKRDALFDPCNLDHSQWPLPGDVTADVEVLKALNCSRCSAAEPDQTSLKSSLSHRRQRMTSTQDLWAGFEAHVEDTNMADGEIHEWRVPSVPESVQHVPKVAFGTDTVRSIDSRPGPSRADSVQSYPDETHAQEKYDAWVWKLYGNTKGPFRCDDSAVNGSEDSVHPPPWRKEFMPWEKPFRPNPAAAEFVPGL